MTAQVTSTRWRVPFTQVSSSEIAQRQNDQLRDLLFWGE